MKILESRPRRYDAGIDWLSFGTAKRLRREIAARAVRPGLRALDLGTGTGELALRCAEQGAEVIGIDVSGAMLAVAEAKRKQHPQGGQIRFIEASVAEMDMALADESFDVVTASLVFSELSEDEQKYALRQIRRLLVADGLLVIADETRPQGLWRLILYHLVRLPLAVITFLFTQTTTRPVLALEEKAVQAGFVVEKVERRNLQSLLVLFARKRVVE
ncbi:MAG: corrinoid protein-associated methyltransferase CpaM [Alphaproteobacteria bacterium]